MTAFYDGQYDVLLSTTIVESGLDVPTAIFPCWVHVVHDEPLFGGKAGIDKALLPVPGFQHVQCAAFRNVCRLGG